MMVYKNLNKSGKRAKVCFKVGYKWVAAMNYTIIVYENDFEQR